MNELSNATNIRYIRSKVGRRHHYGLFHVTSIFTARCRETNARARPASDRNRGDLSRAQRPVSLKIIAGCNYFLTEKLVDAFSSRTRGKNCFVKKIIAAVYYFLVKLAPALHISTDIAIGNRYITCTIHKTSWSEYSSYVEHTYIL